VVSEGRMMTDGRRTKLSAVIACYRDAAAVPIMHQRLRQVFGRLDVSGEIIFVNDASDDGAAEVLHDLAASDPDVVVVNHSRNFGSQSAFTSGMRISTGDAVVLMDGDLQDPPELIEQFVQRWREGHDVVYGVRVTREAATHMRFLYKAFYRLFRTTAYVRIPVDAGDFSLIDRRVVTAMNALPERNRFIRGLRAWVGFKQVGVEYVRPERMFGRTTNSFMRNLAWARQAILSFSYVPLELITWLGLITVGAAFVAIILQAAVKILHPSSAPSGLTTVILLILLMGGIQLLCLSIIGSYLAHIYDEVKRRPPYIVDSILNQPPADSDD
jgi:glycosyltransferase involved in cell wall biosynthesis